MDAERKAAVGRLCPELDERTREDFLSRMDPDYFAQYPPEKIAGHLRMSARLSREHPVEAEIVPLGGGAFELAIVAFDYFSEFSILCGLISSFGLDIQSGNIYTFSEARPAARPRAPGPRRPVPGPGSRRKIVDVFRVQSVPETDFNDDRRKEFARELEAQIRRLDEGRFDEARESVNRRLVESLSARKSSLRGLLFPVEVRFDNDSSEVWTVMETRSRDIPGFLYAFTNALSLRGIYIHGVRIENIGPEVRDRFFISDRLGRKILSKNDQEALQAAVALIKQFTYYLASAPDPAMAIRHFDRLLDRALERGAGGGLIDLLNKPEALTALARLLGASDFLWEDFLRIQLDNLVPVLREAKGGTRLPDKTRLRRGIAAALRRAKTPDEEKAILNARKDREMFRIDLRHLSEARPDLAGFSRALTDLAEAVLAEALRICVRRLQSRHGRPRTAGGAVCPVAICGLGKFGGREMGYASDIELLFVYGGPGRTDGRESIENSLYFERLVQELLQLIEARQEGIFHIDLRLRPDGSKGPLANPLDRIRSYYGPGGGAAPFERQALTKLRAVAGDVPLGRAVEAHRDRFVYGGEPWDLPAALNLRERQIAELVRPGTINVKLSPGGVIDIEYAVQYLQLMNGKERPRLRTPSTLQALEELGRAEILSSAECGMLREAYFFLRNLIDALRIVRGNAQDLVLPPTDSEEFKFLARRMRYGGEDWEGAARRLSGEIRTRMGAVQEFFAGRFRKSAAR